MKAITLNKHIAKKGMFQTNQAISLPQDAQIIESLENIDLQKILKSKRHNQDLLFQTKDGSTLKFMSHNRNGHHHLIPFPDLTLVYFDSAYNLNQARKNEEKHVFKDSSSSESYGNVEFHGIYSYYGYASSCIVLLFTTIESFINNQIPDDFIYSTSSKKCTESYTKDQIQRYLSFDEKTKSVLEKATKKKNFQKANPTIAVHINNLKEIRDSIVHPKSSENHIAQEELIKKILKFKFEETIGAVMQFLNYYVPNYIEECTCGEDY